MRTRNHAPRAVLLLVLVAAACGDSGSSSEGPPPYDPYQGTPPTGAPIGLDEGTVIESLLTGPTEWRWIPFADAFCTDAVRDQQSGAYQFGTSATGLAISWGAETSTDVVIFLQGGGACWDFVTCGGATALDPRLDKTASTGPFGPAEFATDIYDRYPFSWVRRDRLPPALAAATIVFVPYCTGDVHSGDAVTTYPSLGFGLPAITWHHVGHANLMAFLKRLGPTFPTPGKLIVAGSSAGGFGSLANYPAFRWYWPSATGYLVDDSGPPLIRDAIPASTRAGWYASWNMAASLDAFCPECRTDMSAGLRILAERYPQDRIALLSHLQDAVIRGFFGTFTLTPTPSFTPMDPNVFETELRRLGTVVVAPHPKAKYFFTAGESHPTLEDPRIMTPSPGLEAWLELMFSDSGDWTSVTN